MSKLIQFSQHPWLHGPAGVTACGVPADVPRIPVILPGPCFLVARDSGVLPPTAWDKAALGLESKRSCCRGDTVAIGRQVLPQCGGVLFMTLPMGVVADARNRYQHRRSRVGAAEQVVIQVRGA